MKTREQIVREIFDKSAQSLWAQAARGLWEIEEAMARVARASARRLKVVDVERLKKRQPSGRV